MRDYRVRIFGRGPYSWGEAIETIRARSASAALEAALLRAQWRFTFADSFDAEILPELTDAETNASLTGDATVPYRNARLDD